MTNSDDTWSRKKVGGSTAGRVVAGATVTGASGAVAVIVLYIAEDVLHLPEIHLEEAAAVTTVIIILGNGLIGVFGEWVRPVLVVLRDRLIKRVSGKK